MKRFNSRVHGFLPLVSMTTKGTWAKHEIDIPNPTWINLQPPNPCYLLHEAIDVHSIEQSWKLFETLLAEVNLLANYCFVQNASNKKQENLFVC